MENLIFETIVGSRAYGTNTENSDTDKKGIFMQPIDDLISFGYVEQINITKDETYYELRRFIELCATGNPTALEMLFTPDDCILTTSPQFELLKENRHKFLTKKCAMAFGNYGTSQIIKADNLNKKMNWEKDRITQKTPLDFIYYTEKGKSYPFKQFLSENNLKQENCGLVRLDHMKDCYALYYNPNGKYHGVIGESSNEIRLSSVEKGVLPLMMIYYNVDTYSKHCKDYKDYQTWLKNRNIDRYVDTQNHLQRIDGKNMLHCRRLIEVAIEIATTGNMTVKRPNAEYLLSIKQGKVNLKDLISQAEKDIIELKELYENSNLPDDVDPKFIKELLLKIRKL